MNIEIKLFEYFGEECGNGKKAVKFLIDEVKPKMEQHKDSIFIFDFTGIKRMNSSFSNALFGNFYVLYGDNKLKVKNIKSDLSVMVVSGLEHGMQLAKQAQNTEQISFLSRLKNYINRS